MKNSDKCILTSEYDFSIADFLIKKLLKSIVHYKPLLLNIYLYF